MFPGIQALFVSIFPDQLECVAPDGFSPTQDILPWLRILIRYGSVVVKEHGLALTSGTRAGIPQYDKWRLAHMTIIPLQLEST